MKHKIIEYCINLVFDELTKNFIIINADRNKIMREYYDAWRNFNKIKNPNLIRVYSYEEFLDGHGSYSNEYVMDQTDHYNKLVILIRDPNVPDYEKEDLIDNLKPDTFNSNYGGHFND